jgi:hypothetical protein
VLSRTLPRQRSWRLLRRRLGLVFAPSGLGAVHLEARSRPCNIFRTRMWSRRNPQSLGHDNDPQYPVSGACSPQDCVTEVSSFEKRSDDLDGWLRAEVYTNALF